MKVSLSFFCELNGEGGSRDLAWDDLTGRESKTPIWIHLNRKTHRCVQWLEEQSHVDSLVCEALLAEETRPRSAVIDNGLLVILRAVNLNEGEEPEEMISIRIWIEEHRVISLAAYHLKAVEHLRSSLSDGKGPLTSSGVLVQLAEEITDHIEPVITVLDDEIDSFEENILKTTSHKLRNQIADTRRRVIHLHRYLAPQRDVYQRLQFVSLAWINDEHRASFHETTDRITRYVEMLDAAREHATVAQDELIGHQNEKMSRKIYLLSLVTTVFLPLSFVTGLLGINVGGIPGANHPLGFAIVCLLLSGLIAFQIWIFHRMRFF